MLTVFALAVPSGLNAVADFDAELVMSKPAYGIGSRTWISGLTLTSHATVAGYYCESVGVHGESFMGRPFAWKAGILHWLPLGGNEYGHVYGGNARMLVGDVEVNYVNHPAIWTPDLRTGWKNARLKILSNDEGWAVSTSPGGAVWVVSGGEVKKWSQGSWKSTKVGRFSLVGVDAKERLFGNAFEGYGEGMSPRGNRAAVFDGKTWTFLAEKKEYSWLNCVNSRGEAVGVSGGQAVLWTAGRETRLFGEGTGSSDSNCINEKGEVVGSFTASKGKRAAYLWRNGTLRSLASAVPGVGLEEALAINDSGAIVARAEVGKDVRLYLLKPKPKR